LGGLFQYRLQFRFGSEAVFMDVDSIPYGADFRQHLTQAMRKCEVFLAVIADRWLSVDQQGRRRLDEPDEFVPIENEGYTSSVGPDLRRDDLR
jgi:hypothetical protein